MVPTFMCSFVRSNLALAMDLSLSLDPSVRSRGRTRGAKLPRDPPFAP
jgi:hypothetical protein